MRQKEYSSIMNKNTAYVLSAALALSVCGCSTQTTSSPADSSSGLSVPGAAASSGSIATFSFSTLPKAPREAISQKTPRKLTPEQQKAESEFNKKLSSARQEINRGKYAEGEKLLKALESDTSVSGSLRLQAMQERVNSLTRQNKYAEALDLNQKILENKDLAPDRLLSVLDAKRVLLERSGKYEDSVLAGIAILTQCPLTPAQEKSQQNSIIHNLARAKHFDAAVSLIREQMADPNCTPEEKVTLYGNIIGHYQTAGSLDKAYAVTQEVLSLPGFTGDAKANMLLRSADILMRMKPPKPADADRIALQITEDDAYSNSARIRALTSMANRVLSDRKAVTEPVISASEKLLGSASLSDLEKARLLEQISKVAKKDSASSGKMLESAQAILALPSPDGASSSANSEMNRIKIAASWTIAEHQALNGKMDEAMKTVRIPLQLKNLSTENVISLQSNIARLYQWQRKQAEAIQAYRDILKTDSSPSTKARVNGLIAKLLLYFNDVEGAAKVYRESGDPLGEANVYQKNGEPEKAREIARKILEDEKQSLKDRSRAYEFFISPDAESRKLMEKYLSLWKSTKPNGYLFFNQLRTAMQYADYGFALRCAEILSDLDSHKKDFFTHLYRVNALAGLGRLAEAGKLAGEEALNPAFKPSERYRLALTSAALLTPEHAGALQKAFKAVDEKSQDRALLSNKEISDAIIKAGRTAMIANKPVVAKDIYKVYESLYVPQEKKRYDVGYSEIPVSGIVAWEALKNQPEKQLMDRSYGGNMDFLVTDVSTGNRGGGIGSAGEDGKAKKRYTEFSALADVNGVHFLFHAYDDRAKEVEARLLGAGSYEIYLAPGTNQPYFCVLPNLQTGDSGLWQTTYNNEHHRRPKLTDGSFRTEHVFTPDGYKTYFFFDWDLFYDKIPDKGDLWDFENIQWGRDGGFSWNGTKTIHGRSTWGNLAFDLTEAQKNAIRRKIIFKALSDYKSEKVTSGRKAGIIDFWRDPELGDPDFYEKVVAPYVAELDKYIPLVKADMSDEDVKKVFSEAVPGWKEIRFKLDEMRRKYLEEKLSR